ncbi:MAG: hypothetical protein BWK73_12055 [Thiothrix lacustris]|uniref:Uncharacterized protein n=1 Tax=Thiothrix lacustris TaxID=525917 RepID=A0A1Y1QUD8_9GAMM|nr:MAG: hypothetical protein BWK73_12055 [Thiothrix lacustris]
MTEQLAPIDVTTTETNTPSNAWLIAQKRANDYLKLHRLLDSERERLLAQITNKLARAGLFSEQELIHLFITTAQEELALLQAKESDNRTPTGPLFERSSIRVAPLQAITLLPSSRPRSRLLLK